MRGTLINHRNKSSKILLYTPLSGEHSALGPVRVMAIADDCFYLSTEGALPQGSLKGILKITGEDGRENLSFEGTLHSSLSEDNCLEFDFDRSRFGEQASKLLIRLRKNQHISICNKEDVESSSRFTGFSKLHFLPEALPELNESDVDTSSSLLGKKFSYPFFITGMTGGVSEGQRINENLAYGASELGIPMGLGSQRMALEHPEYSGIFVLKDKYPDLCLFGNMGFSDLLKETDPVSYCQRAVDMVEADAFAIHLNVIQECVQTEGNRDFKGFLKLIGTLCEKLEVPVIVKEVGCGVGPAVAKRLEEAGVKVLDVGGKGGTSWSQVESFRVSKEEGRLGRSFRDWGIPTAYTLAAVKSVCQEMEITATGGFRDGQTVAKACALGAHMCGLGLPIFKAAVQSPEEVLKELQLVARQLRVTLLATGSAHLKDLSSKLTLGEPLEKEFHVYLERLGRERVR